MKEDNMGTILKEWVGNIVSIRGRNLCNIDRFAPYEKEYEWNVSTIAKTGDVVVLVLELCIYEEHIAETSSINCLKKNHTVRWYVL